VVKVGRYWHFVMHYVWFPPFRCCYSVAVSPFCRCKIPLFCKNYVSEFRSVTAVNSKKIRNGNGVRKRERRNGNGMVETRHYTDAPQWRCHNFPSAYRAWARIARSSLGQGEQCTCNYQHVLGDGLLSYIPTRYQRYPGEGHSKVKTVRKPTGNHLGYFP